MSGNLNDLRDALRVLARIALIDACANSEPDVMGVALDEAVADAQRFFQDHPNLKIGDVI